jgi:4'-phosphopantetheinyl transferase
LTSIEIGADEVHLWETALSVRDDELARIGELLSPEESEYAGDFRNARARRQYVISRGMLRRLLSYYLGKPAADLRFETEGDGKPVLAGERGVQFNLSHSGELVVYAVAASRPVGVDLEHLRPVPRAVELAYRYLSPEERETIAAAPPQLRDREFLSSWVKREAYAKARGTSVWRALESRYQTDAATAQEGRVYAVRLLDYSDKYVAAVAAAGSDWRVVRQGGIWYGS